METINRGIYKPNYAINKLKYATVNRDMTLNHAENFKTKLIDYGWMMPVVVSKTGDVLEGPGWVAAGTI